VLGRRRPTSRGAWPVHARLANAELAHRLRARTGADLHDLGPMRAARRDRLLDLGLGDRRSGYPLEMVLSGAAAGMRIAEQDVDYRPRAGRSKVTGTLRGTRQAIHDMRAILAARPATLLVIAKSPQPGRVKTRLTPVCTPEQAARLAEAALVDTLTTLARVPAGRRILVLDGPPGRWLPPGWEVVPQSGGSLDARLAAAFTSASEGPGSPPALLVRLDTPRLHAAPPAAGLPPRCTARPHLPTAGDTARTRAVPGVAGEGLTAGGEAGGVQPMLARGTHILAESVDAKVRWSGVSGVSGVSGPQVV